MKEATVLVSLNAALTPFKEKALSLPPSRYHRVLSLRVERQGHEADLSPPSSVEIKKGRAIPPLPHVFIAWCLTN
jgi:hypothetical protein